MNITKAVIHFLRKEIYTNDNIRSNGNKLFIKENNKETCVGQWNPNKETRIIVNDTVYDNKDLVDTQKILKRTLNEELFIYNFTSKDVPLFSNDLIKYL